MNMEQFRETTEMQCREALTAEQRRAMLFQRGWQRQYMDGLPVLTLAEGSVKLVTSAPYTVLQEFDRYGREQSTYGVVWAN